MSPAEGGGEKVAVERVFISAGCNRIVNNVSWSPSGIVSFGAQNAVAIFCPESAQILTTLPGHKSVVNCTEWVPNKKDFHKVGDREIHYLLSGSSDGAIILWEINPKKRQWNLVMQLPEVHKKGVTCITSLMISQNTAIFASTSSDGIVQITELTLPFTQSGNCQMSCLDSISVGNKPMVSLSLCILPNENTSLLLAMAGLDQKIHIYYSTPNQKFTHSCELKGHSDWIRGLDFSLPISPQNSPNPNPNYEIYLASSSQDKSIRIWKLSSSSLQKDESQKDEFTLSSFTSGPSFSTGSTRLTISLESLLLAHEDWVYSVKFHPSSHLTLLSSSMDKTMMIWRPEPKSGIWMNVVTVGELLSNSLGFYGGEWGSDGKQILGYGYGGAFHMWRDLGERNSESGICEEEWRNVSVPSGHFGGVFDISWGKKGEYLVSVSHDQTTRIFSPWRNTSNSDNNNNEKDRWHEITRPQIHGHDINCLCVLEGSGNPKFVSGADEKVARVFEAPVSFLKTLNYALEKDENSDDFNNNNNNKDVQILGANMSALGLSQKPIYSTSSVRDQEMSRNSSSTEMEGLERIPEVVPTIYRSPPVEDQLSWNTLWPESHKLYGHGNELFSLCCNHSGTLLASSCKAQTGGAAEVWIWEVGSWKAVGRLRAHTLTVTQLEFSFDDKYLLAVSRDRHLSVFYLTNTPEGVEHELIVKQEGHKRIIWACAWAGSSHVFATGSRDKTVKIWSLNNSSGSVNLVSTLPQFKDSVTALAWMRDYISVGMDNGLIEVWRVKSGFGVECVVKFDLFMCHVASVHRLRWKREEEREGVMKLGSCGADHSVRVFDVFVK